MKQINLGNSGLQVGSLGIGTLTWGRDTEKEDAIKILTNLLDAGGNFVDLSPIYGEGKATASLGTLLNAQFSRDELVLCAHVGYQFTPAGVVANLGRGGIRASVTKTLHELNTDYLDLLLLDAPDALTSLPETLDTLANLVQRGYVNYLGLNRFPAWLAAIITQYCQDHNLPLINALATEYSLLHRKAEQSSFALANHANLGIIAFSPLAGGVLTGKYRNTIPPTSRAATKHLSPLVAPYLESRARQVTEAVIKAADGLGRTPTDVSLAWTFAQTPVQVAVCGPRTGNQADQLFSLDISPLPPQVTEVLSEVSAL